MYKILKSKDRGVANHGWLSSKHTFSFADYYNPDSMNFKSLRVINEDIITGGTGFGMHPHKDMEIITYVIKGGLFHEDSYGNKTTILPGEVQRMSAGTGIRHSEFNFDKVQDTHLFQIWIQPNKLGMPFNYGQKSFAEEINLNNLVLVISNTGRDESISINQDADIYISKLKKSLNLNFDIRNNRSVWIQVINGLISINGESLLAGDAFSTSSLEKLSITAIEDSEMMIFDLA
jgi:hypothetical protein